MEVKLQGLSYLYQKPEPMYEKEPVLIFVVEDDASYSKFLKHVLSLNPDFDTEFFSTGNDDHADVGVEFPGLL